MRSRDDDPVAPIHSARRQMAPGIDRDHGRADLLDRIGQIARQRLQCGCRSIFHGSPPDFYFSGGMANSAWINDKHFSTPPLSAKWPGGPETAGRLYSGPPALSLTCFGICFKVAPF